MERDLGRWRGNRMEGHGREDRADKKYQHPGKSGGVLKLPKQRQKQGCVKTQDSAISPRRESIDM